MSAKSWLTVASDHFLISITATYASSGLSEADEVLWRILDEIQHEPIGKADEDVQAADDNLPPFSAVSPDAPEQPNRGLQSPTQPNHSGFDLPSTPCKDPDPNNPSSRSTPNHLSTAPSTDDSLAARFATFTISVLASAKSSAFNFPRLQHLSLPPRPQIQISKQTQQPTPIAR